MIEVDDQGVGNCPKRPALSRPGAPQCSHERRGSSRHDFQIWPSDVTIGETGGYFGRATAARRTLFDGLKAPMQNGTGDPAKARRKP